MTDVMTDVFGDDGVSVTVLTSLCVCVRVCACVCVSQYGRSDSYRVATTTDKDEKESSPKKAATAAAKDGKDLDDLKKEVPLVRTRPLPVSCLGTSRSTPYRFGPKLRPQSASNLDHC